MYDPTNNLVPNPIDRWTIGSLAGGYQKAEDGSLTLYLQKDSPGKDKEANWLPAPAGDFWVVFRTCGPGKERVDQTWKLPPLEMTKSLFRERHSLFGTMRWATCPITMLSLLSMQVSLKDGLMKKTRYLLLFSALCSVLAVSLLTGCNMKTDLIGAAEQANIKAGIAAPGIAEIKAIAEEGFLYGLPIVMNYAVMNEFCVDKNSGQYKAPFNTVFNEARVFTYKDTAVVTPNADTPYSMIWLDLRTEPMVISVPAVPKERYYSLQLIDGNTYNYGYIGSRATGSEAGSYLIVGPGWEGDKPAGIEKVFQSSTPFSLTVVRTQLFDPDDMPNVIEVQAGYRLQPLSAFLNQPAPPAAAKIDFVPATTKGIRENFFAYLDAELEFVPVTPENKEIRDRLASVGIGPGKTIDLKDLSPEHGAELKAVALLSMKEGGDQVKTYLDSGMENINGWRMGALFGDSSFYAGDWLKRSAAAVGGIYGNDAEEAVYPMARTDAKGEALDGSKHNYTLTFPAGQLPPVNAFWSVTMYDGKTQLLIENPINRNLVNSPMLPDMKKNADGSLTIYIQKDSPGKDKESNWLPAPNGPIYLVMRLYWPKTEAPSILPPGEGTWAPPGIVKVN